MITNKKYIFFVGTIAEFIKIFPIIKQFDIHNISYDVIASGQNDIRNSELFKYIRIKPRIYLSKNFNKQTALYLLYWFILTFIKGLSIFKKFKQKRNSIIIIHGDTISTVMGGLLGKIYGIKIAHIEAGLRSFDYINPFPEEINRVIVSHLADIHYCPNTWAKNNLSSRSGIKINTRYNTLIDSLTFALKKKAIRKKGIFRNMNDKYFMFVLHRQENLFNQKFVKLIVNKVLELSKEMKCVFILHDLTKKTLRDLKLLKKLINNKNIVLVPRMYYIDFIKTLSTTQFLITDGGSNQEESYYMGKPCLILRKKTERIEGLTGNAVLALNNINYINIFFSNFLSYCRKKVLIKESPSNIIFKHLIRQ